MDIGLLVMIMHMKNTIQDLGNKPGSLIMMILSGTWSDSIGILPNKKKKKYKYYSADIIIIIFFFFFFFLQFKVGLLCVMWIKTHV